MQLTIFEEKVSESEDISEVKSWVVEQLGLTTHFDISIAENAVSEMWNEFWVNTKTVLTKREENIMISNEIQKSLMGMSVSELTELQQFASELKIMKNKSGLSVGQRVYVVQKTKKTPETIRKNQQDKSDC